MKNIRVSLIDYIFCITAICIVALCNCVTANAATRTMNYVMAIEPRYGSASTPLDDYDMSVVTVNYFDALGREVQMVRKHYNPDGYDVVSSTSYDSRGNVSRKYLPVPSLFDQGEYCADVQTLSAQAYGDNVCYTEYLYRAVPEVMEETVYNPGQGWRNDNGGHGINTEYGFNGTAPEHRVVRYYVNGEGGLVNDGYHYEGNLKTKTVSDENGNRTIYFSGRAGEVLLIRRIDGSFYADTYYVYNTAGKLCYMLSPEGAALLKVKGVCSTEVINDLCYGYRYDDRGRLFEKRLPGAEPVYYVYDKLNRVLLWQDGNQRLSSEWSVNKYDSNMRLAVRGFAVIRGATRGSLQEQYGNSTFIEVPEPEKEMDMYLFYSQKSGPAGFSAQQAWFYDDYRHWALSSGVALPEDAEYEKQWNVIKATGMNTGTVVTDNMGGVIITAVRYNDRGTPVAQFERDYAGSYRIETYTGVDFRNLPFKKKCVTYIGSEGYMTETHKQQWTYEYDQGERLVAVRHKYGENAWVVLAGNSYDGMCRLKKSCLGALSSGKVYSEMGYNIRGWVTTLNTPFFSQELFYNNPPAGGNVMDGGLGQYNGNVSAMNVSMRFPVPGGAPVERSYTAKYSYSAMDMLSKCYTERNGEGAAMYEDFVYDANGNVLLIGRNNELFQETEFGYKGNRITGISSTVNGVTPDEGAYFKDGVFENPYGYDANGNVTRDDTRDIASVLYNRLNLPHKVNFKDGSYSTSVYRTDGVKISRTNTTKRVTTTVKVDSKGNEVPVEKVSYDVQARMYIGDLIRENGKTKRIYNEAGYIELDASTGVPQYFFHVKDYLGSVRSVADAAGNLVQATDYYSGGFPVTPEGSPMNAEERLHTGKEFNAFNGLCVYDNGARSNDPLTVRFLQQDPLAEKYPHLSPYASCANNPLKFTDPDGREVRAATSNAQNLILNTLNSKDIPYVSFDNGGNINKDMINSHTSNSGNFQSLQEIVNNETMVDLSVANSFTYKDDNGSLIQRDMGTVSVDPDFIRGIYSPNTNETGFLGITQTPADGSTKYNSPDNIVRITINNTASINGQSQTTAHELYGHGSLYVNGESHKHDTRGGGQIDHNTKLLKKITNAVNETIENMEERNNAK